MKKKLFIIIIVIITLFSVGCANTQDINPESIQDLGFEYAYIISTQGSGSTTTYSMWVEYELESYDIIDSCYKLSVKGDSSGIIVVMLVPIDKCILSDQKMPIGERRQQYK